MDARAPTKRQIGFEKLEDRILLTTLGPQWETSVLFASDGLVTNGHPQHNVEPVGVGVDQSFSHPRSQSSDPLVRFVESSAADDDDNGDDSAAIQAAIDQGPGTVHVGPGSYQINSTLVLSDNVELVLDPDAALRLGDGVNQPLISATNTTGIAIRGGLLLGNPDSYQSQAATHLIQVTESTDVVVEGVRLTDTSGYGLSLSECSEAQVIGVEQWGSNGRGGITLSDCSNSVIASSVTRDNRGHNLSGRGYGLYVERSHRIEIRNHVATGNSNDNLVIFDSEDIHVAGGQFNNSTEDKGAHIQNVLRLLMQDAEFLGNARQGAEIGAAPTGSGNGVAGSRIERSRFVGNQLDGLHLHGDGVMMAELEISGNAGRGFRAHYSTPSNNTIVNSVVRNNMGIGIQLDHASNWSIRGSQVFDDQLVPTQTFGMGAASDSLNILLEDTDLQGNRYGEFSPSNDVALTILSNKVRVINLLKQTAIGETRAGIGARDDGTGAGYILFSEQTLQERLDPPPVGGNADHLVAVVVQNGEWWYDDNSQLRRFEPRPSDLLVAEVDYDADTVTLLEGVDGVNNGIEMGYVGSDLVITPNQFGGRPNDGEFDIHGSFLERNVAKTLLGDLQAGIPAIDGSMGVGYIMFSAQSAYDRFATKPTAGSAEHLIVVVFQGGQWHYDNNSELVPFEPRGTDLLVAEVDFATVTAISLKGVRAEKHGIEMGYQDGDLILTSNQFGSLPNAGEFGAAGSAIVRHAPPQQSLGGLMSGIGVRDDASGVGYVLYSEQNVFDRLSPQPTLGNAEHLVAVFMDRGDWFYDNNDIRVPFTTQPSDRILATVDFKMDEVTMLVGVGAEIGGIAAGYGAGDIQVIPNVFDGAANDGELGVIGTFFYSADLGVDLRSFP